METPTSPTQPNHLPTDKEVEQLLQTLKPVPDRSKARAARTEYRFMAELDLISLPASSSAGATSGGPAASITSFFTNLFKRKDTTMFSQNPRVAFSSLAAIALIILLLLGGISTTAYASQSTIPGDTLYPVKTGLEQARASLARDAADRAELYLQYADRRMDEISRLVSAGRFSWLGSASAEFEQYIQKTLAEIPTIAASDPARAAAISQQVTDALTRYAQALTSLKQQVPADVYQEVDDAYQHASDDASSLPGYDDSEEMEFTGLVEATGPDSWMVAGRTFAVTAMTAIKGTIAVGDMVKVHTYYDGTVLTAREIALYQPESSDDPSLDDSSMHEIEFTGVIEAMDMNLWTIDGRAVTITDQTEVKGELAVGDMVKVHAYDDGSTLTASEIERSDDSSYSDDSSDDHSGSDSSYSDDSKDDSSDYKDGSSDDHSDDSSDDDHSDDSSDDHSGSDNHSDDSRSHDD